MREAYAAIAAAAIERVVRYVKEHPSGRGEQLDLRAWALACYKLTYDTKRFSTYLDVNWRAVDAEIFGDEEENEELKQEIEDALQNNSEDRPKPVVAKRLSFAWLLAREIFALLEQL